MKDTSVHEDPNLLRAGVSRSQIATAFGAPNETSDQGGQVQDVYEFNPDGSKFVKPKVYARNIAAGVFTGGIATVVHQARIHHTEQQLTVYRLRTDRTGLCSRCRKNRASRKSRTAQANLNRGLLKSGSPSRSPGKGLGVWLSVMQATRS